MVNFVPVTGSRYANKAWKRPTGFSFAAAQALVPLVGVEFAKAAVSIPIAFIKEAGRYLPVAVMSPISGRNLFIGPAGQWLGGYVPAALRSYPFRLGRAEGAEGFTLCMDEDAGLVTEADGTAEELIGADGHLSAAARMMLDLLIDIERNRAVTDAAVAALSDAGMIRPWPLEVRVDQQAVPPIGFFRIDAASLDALDDPTFLKLRRVGALVLAYLQLTSMLQTAVFNRLNLVQQQLAQTHFQQRQLTSLDEVFGEASGETLRFH